MSTDKKGKKKGKSHRTCLWVCIIRCDFRLPSLIFLPIRRKPIKLQTTLTLRTRLQTLFVSRWTTSLPVGVA